MPRYTLFGLLLLLPIANAVGQIPFIQSPNSGAVRNNYSGYVGMYVTVGSAPITVTSLARFDLAGNTQSHTVKVVNALTGVDVPGASVQVTMSAASVGTFVYGALPAPIQLTAGTPYLVLSLEVSGGDTWQDLGRVSTTTDASLNGPGYQFSGIYVLNGSGSLAGECYGNVNFQYSLGLGTPFVIGQSGGTLRNNYSGFVGMKLTTGAQPLTINALGRIFVVGNSGTHTVKLVNATTGQDLPGGSVQLNMAGGTASTIKYAPLSTPVDLPANSSYYLVSQETSGGDQWYDYGPITVTTVATVPSAVYSTNSGYATMPGTNLCYGPLGFLYTLSTPLITAQTPGTSRSDFSGFVGMRFGLGNTPLTITQLGRFCLSGNSQTHTVKLVQGNGTDLAGGSVSVSMVGCTPGQYAYGLFFSPITLGANTTWDLVSSETSGGDQWANYGPVTSTPIASVVDAIYSTPNTTDTTVPVAGYSYGPVNLQYESATAQPVSLSTGTAPTLPTVSISSPSANATVSGTLTITVAAGTSLQSVQFLENGNNIGSPVVGYGPYLSTTLDTRLLPNGEYILSAIATDSAGNHTLSNSEGVTILNNLGQPSVSVTSPGNASSGSGLIAVAASATPASGTTVASLQLQVDGQSFGSVCTTSTCSASLDTTILPNGRHLLSAVAFDSDEGHAVSASVAITVNNAVTGIGLLNGIIPGLARNFAGWIGMHLTTGCTALSVSAVGRIFVPGNTATHLVKFVNASDGSDVPGGSATVSFTGAIANQIIYAPLAAPITLQPNTGYYLVSLETASGDQFYDYMPVLSMGAATINGPAYMPSGSSWITPSAPNNIYVPVDFKFTVPGIPFPAAITSLAPGTASNASITPIVPAACNQILIAGQSLAAGTLGSPALTVTQPYSDLTLSAGNAALVPLIEGQGYGYSVGKNDETVGSSLGDILTRLSPANSFTDIVTNAALGGAPYSELEKGTVAYAAGIAQLTAAKNLTLAASKSYKFSGVAVMHGESDEGAGASAATYESYLVQWQNNFQSDGQAISGQSDSVPFFIDQTNSWTYGNLATPTISLGQLQAALDYPSTIYMVGPKYQYHYVDGVHMDNVSYRQEGEQFGKAINRVLVGGVALKPFVPKLITRTGNLVKVQFNVPAPPLQFDTSTVLPKSGMGFEYTDGSGCSPFIVSAQITSGDTVTITLSATPTGTNEHLRYAFTGLAGARSGRDISGSAHGNLKDSDNTVSAYGNDLSNWAVAFDQLVTPLSAGK